VENLPNSLKEWKEKQIQTGQCPPEPHECADRPHLPCPACTWTETRSSSQKPKE